jgi:hypothetical protein
MKVKPEWIDGEVAGGGDLQKAYDKSVDGSILTDSVRGSIDFRNGETGADYPILTLGFTGQTPTTSISGVNAKVASIEGTLENVQAGAILGGYQTSVDEYSHGSVSLGGYDTHVTEVSENSLVGSSARVKIKRAILSSVLSSSADPEYLSGGQSGSSTFPSLGYSGYAEIRGSDDKRERIGIGNTSKYQNFILEGNTLIGGSFSHKGCVSINLDLVQLDPESSYFVASSLNFTETRLGITQRFASRVFRKDASTLILVNDAGEILEYNTDTSVSTSLVGGGSSAFTEGMNALSLDSSLVSVVYPRSNGDLLIVLNFNQVVQYSATAGTLSLFAGDGSLWKYFVTTPSDGGDLYKIDTGALATSSNLDKCTAIVEDSSGNIYLADRYNSKAALRMVDSSGTITTKYTWDYLGGDIVSLLVGSTGNVFLGINAPGGTLLAEYNVGTSTVTNRYTSTSYDKGVLAIVMDSSDDSFLLISPRQRGYYQPTNDLELQKISSSFSTVWTNYIVSPTFKIASKHSMLLGTTDSFMDTVEGSGISFARRSSIRSVGGTWNTSTASVSEISASTDVQVVGTLSSSVDSSEEIYMGPIAEILDYQNTKSSKISASSNITLKGSSCSSVSSSSYLNAGGMLSSFIAASSSPGGLASKFCVGALKNTAVLAVGSGNSYVNIGETGPLAGMTGTPNSVEDSLVAANRGGLDLHYMTAVSVSSSEHVMVNSGLSSSTGFPLTVFNSSVSSSRGVTLVGGVSLEVSASEASMIVQSLAASINSSAHVQVTEALRSSIISTTGRVIDHSTECLVAAEGSADSPNNTPYNTPFTLSFSSNVFTYNHRSASVANADVNMAYTNEGFVAGSSVVGVGTTAPYIPNYGAGLTGFFRKVEASFEGIGDPQSAGYTGSQNTVVLGSKAVESIKNIGGTILGSNKVVQYASSYIAAIGMVDYKHVFSDRTVSAGGVNVVVGPYSNDSFFGGNSTTDFKQVQNSIGAGVSSSLIKRANYAAVLASTDMIMEGLDRSGSIWSVGSKATDIISSGMIGAKTGEMIKDVRSGILFSEGATVLESSLSGAFFANGALISNGSGVALIGTESTSIEDGILSSSISTKDSSIFGGGLGSGNLTKSAGVFQAASSNSRAMADTFSVQQATWSSRLDHSQLSFQSAASASGITGSSLATQISVSDSYLRDTSLAAQIAVSQAVVSNQPADPYKSAMVLQAASHNVTIYDKSSMSVQLGAGRVTTSGTVYGSQISSLDCGMTGITSGDSSMNSQIASNGGVTQGSSRTLLAASEKGLIDKSSSSVQLGTQDSKIRGSALVSQSATLLSTILVTGTSPYIYTTNNQTAVQSCLLTNSTASIQMASLQGTIGYTGAPADAVCMGAQVAGLGNLMQYTHMASQVGTLNCTVKGPAGNSWSLSKIVQAASEESFVKGAVWNASQVAVNQCGITGSTTIAQALQTASYHSYLGKSSGGGWGLYNLHQTASLSSRILNGNQVFQAAVYESEVNTDSYQASQIASAYALISGAVSDSAQVASHLTSLRSSYVSAQVAVYGGDTGHGIQEGQCTLQASSSFSHAYFVKQVTQLSSHQSSAARANTSAQIATRNSSMTGLVGCTGYSYGGNPQETGWNYQTVQMSTTDSLVGGAIASTQMAASNSSMVGTRNSAQIAVQDSSITGATASVVMASTNSKVLAVKNAAVIGGIGGLAKNQGELVQGAGGSNGSHQKQTVLFSREVDYDAGGSAWYELFPQGSTQRFKIDADETYYAEIRMALNQISNSNGMSVGGGILKFEGMLYANGGSSALQINSLLTPTWEKHHGAVADAATFLYSSAPWLQATNTNELEVLVTGMTGYTISYTMELSLLKAS